MKRYRIAWSRRALNELASIRAYIAGDNFFAAQEVASSLIKHAESLAVLPHRGRPGLKDGTRELLTPGWPWFIVYKVDEDRIWIVSIQHAAQDRSHESNLP